MVRKLDLGQIDKSFEDKITKTEELEKEEQQNTDTKKADEIISGAQEVFINTFGTVIFEWPSTGILLEGDMLSAKFKAEHLRKGDLLTEAQLKAMYNRPVTIEVDGKSIVVGSGAWTEDHENKLEELPKQIENLENQFNNFRSELQEKQALFNAISENTKIKKEKTERKTLENKIYTLLDEAKRLYYDLATLRLEHLELQNERNILFSSSLEERANMEKVKFFASYCVKIKDAAGNITPLWKDMEEMLTSSFDSVRIVSLLNLFLRGADVAFFGDMQEEAT